MILSFIHTTIVFLFIVSWGLVVSLMIFCFVRTIIYFNTLKKLFNRLKFTDCSLVWPLDARFTTGYAEAKHKLALKLYIINTNIEDELANMHRINLLSEMKSLEATKTFFLSFLIMSAIQSLMVCVAANLYIGILAAVFLLSIVALYIYVINFITRKLFIINKALHRSAAKRHF